jgi:hypothetical protein
VRRGSLTKAGVVSLLVSLLAILPCGCQPATSGEIAARVIITQDFGSELLLDEPVILNSGASALDALERVANVETKYGGGFIEAINGVRSEYSQATVKKDWFFYVNGMSANVGLMDYELSEGDIEHWDFHDWSFHAFIPAIIGDFPQPFVGGYQGKNLPTVVVYDEGFRDAALDLAGELAKLGVQDVRAQAANGLSSQDKEHSNLMLLGTEDFDLISELNENRKLGSYIHFEEGEVVVYDSQGNKARYESECGLIQATQNPWNSKGIGACENVVWMVSGTSESEVQNAVGVLADDHEQFRYAYAAVIVDGEVIKVPE